MFFLLLHLFFQVPFIIFRFFAQIFFIYSLHLSLPFHYSIFPQKFVNTILYFFSLNFFSLFAQFLLSPVFLPSTFFVNYYDFFAGSFLIYSFIPSIYSHFVKTDFNSVRIFKCSDIFIFHSLVYEITMLDNQS